MGFVQEEFEEYAEKAKTLPENTTNESKLILYGLYKQATVGKVNTSMNFIYCFIQIEFLLCLQIVLSSSWIHFFMIFGFLYPIHRPSWDVQHEGPRKVGCLEGC